MSFKSTGVSVSLFAATNNPMSKTERSLLALWFIVNIVIGLFIVRDFGVSYDEPDYYLYATKTVDAYGSFFALAYTPFFGPNDLPNYGPAFIIFPELIIRAVKFILPTVFAADIWHFSYFVLFQLGGLCLYSLARRWYRSWSAWGILLLHTSQPLLWGHAFINPKDIPFMVFCLFTLWSGFRLADSLAAENIDVSLQRPKFDGFSFPQVTIKESLPFLRSPQLLLAGILLGMTMSIRLLGPLPGLVVILYLAFTLRQKSAPVIIAYLICASVTMFLTWPALWPHPIDRWMDSLVLMVSFPWPGRVLFNGRFHEPDQLPLSYLPTLLNIQLTEPLLILAYIGLVLLIYSLFRKRIQLDFFLVVLIGAILPLAGVILSQATMYDNFRQLLFLLLPLILLTGLAFELIFSIVKPAVWRVIMLLLLAFPGVYAMIRLHPYQYVYYNSLVGGTGGALRKFEMDYWCTSYHEAALWLNENAPPNARIGGGGPTYLYSMYLRDDLRARHKSKPGEQYDYFVSTSSYNEDLTVYPDARVVHTIGRDGGVFAVIKQLSP